MQASTRKQTLSRRLLFALPFFLGPALILVAMVMARSDCSFGKTFVDAGATFMSHRSKGTETTLRRLQSDGSMELWDTRHGKFWVPSTSASKLHVIIDEQLQDIYGANTLINEGDTVIDCGADIGTFVRTALNRGASRVIAVEPAPWKISCLPRTFAIDIAVGRVIVYPKGVWNKVTDMKLDEDTLSDRGVEVPLTTIDLIVDELKLDRLDVIKMDTEGAEKPALAGGRNTLRRFRPRLTIATEHKADDHVAIPALVTQLEDRYVNIGCGPCVSQFGRIQPFTMFFAVR